MDKLLLGMEALDFLKNEGFPVLRSIIAKSPGQALTNAEMIGYPVVLKISSKKVIHKTEIGGVKTQIINDVGLMNAFDELIEKFVSSFDREYLEGVIVQESGKGLEFIVGVYEDKQFGPVIMLGHGGIHVEALNDVSFRLLPIRKRDARLMIEDLLISKVLFSSRQDEIDALLIEEFLIKVSNLVEKNPKIKEMDLNPVFVSKEIKICDARIRLSI
ncbi:MAG: acetate--CoA ligase family protein [Deltaproteobacteria bacterium]|nr:acetate--CoA ligase family protein [Deltaproteobacteria bacterium]